MRLIIITAIQDGAVSRCHLDHRTVEVLSEGIRCQLGPTDLIRLEAQVLCVGLSRKIDTGIPSKAEQTLILYKGTRFFRKCDIHHDHIAGIGNAAGHIQNAVTVPVDTVDLPGMDAVRQLHVAVTAEGIIL